MQKKHLFFFVVCLVTLSSMTQKFQSIPDTLDLRNNAKLSINFLKGTMDKHQKGVTYFNTYFGADPSASSHKFFDLDEIPGRFLYGFVSARQITGSIEGMDHEVMIKEYLLSRMVHDDGMVYMPKYSLLCTVTGADSAWMWGNRSVFMGLLSLYMINDDPLLKLHLDRAVNALYNLAVRKGEDIFLNQKYFACGQRIDSSKPPILGQNMGGWITPLITYYQWTGNKYAFELAQGFSKFIVRHHGKAGPHNRILKIANTHGALFTIGGILRVAKITADKSLLEWSKNLIDYTTQNLATSFGWIQEHEDDSYLRAGDEQSCESCSVADLVNCCIYLAKNGYDEYWNFVERYTRNYLEEAQLKHTEWMPNSEKRDDTVHESYQDIPERIKGAYVGWGNPNDFVNPKARARNCIQNCCGPHCAWATFLVWHNIVTKDSEGIHVNLSLNKKTHWCQINSYRPYEGRVSIEMFIDDDLHLRIPDWVNRSKIQIRINNQIQSPKWHGNYVCIANCKQGDIVDVFYPMKLMTKKDVIKNKGEYTTRWKGDTVVAIDPPGKIVPLFQREYMMKDECPTKKERKLEPGARVEIPIDEIDW